MPLFLKTDESLTSEIVRKIINDETGNSLRFTITTIIVIAVIVVLLVLYLGNLIKNLMSNNEYLKIGPVTIKNRKKARKDKTLDPTINAHASNLSNSRVIDIDSFMNIMDIVMSVELERVIMNSVNATNEIHKLELTYDEQSESIFSKTFVTIQNEYHDQLVLMACEKTGFDINKIKDTREYFYIIDLLREFNEMWMKQSKEITRRNGFVEFLEDKAKSKVYIDELNDCIFQCIDIRKLESTDLRKADLEKVIYNVQERTQQTLERMFINLANIKKMMLTKRKDKMEYIDNVIKNSVINILTDIRTKILNNDSDLSSAGPINNVSTVVGPEN